MATKRKTPPKPDQGNIIKAPGNWKTGDEPATGAQKSYLNTLAEQAGVDIDENVTKAEASEQIDELRDKASPDANGRKDPNQWKTGDEPMTGAQKSYLLTLCEELGEKFDEKLTKAQASERIDELKERNPRTKE